MIIPYYMIIHHSAAQDDNGLDYDNYLDFHVKVRLWLDIGYNAVNEEIEGRSVNIFGRPLTIPGAHCPALRMNYLSYGFCFAGNFNKIPGPSDQRILDAVRRVIVPVMLQYNIPIDHVRPHRYYMKTDCPGKMFRWDKLIGEIKGAIDGLRH